MLHSPCSDSDGESIHQGTIHSLVGDMEGVSGMIIVKGHPIDTLKVRKLCLIQDITPLLQGAEGKAEGGGNTVGRRLYGGPFAVGRWELYSRCFLWKKGADRT